MAKATVAEKEITKTFKTTQSLKCQLTQDEILQAGLELAEACEMAGKLEDEKKAVVDQYKAKASMVDSTITIKRSLVQNRFDIRPVPCEEIHNLTSGTVKTIRTDTNEVLREREMTQEERQGKIFDEK